MTRLRRGVSGQGERARPARRRVLAPEVVQTSAMDCGPAALKCLLEAHGIPISYARLQEACQTDLDGTSINTIEQVAIALGLDAEQIMVPIDHVLLDPAKALPALIVVRRDNLTHFLVAWRRHGRLIQLMDPAKGRRWLARDAFAAELYVHHQRVPADGWRAWAGSAEFLDSLNVRLRALRIPAAERARLLRAAGADTAWRGLAMLDASVRMVTELATARGIGYGAEAMRLLDTLLARAREGLDPYTVIPDTYWSVLRDPAVPSGETIIFRGAVLLRVKASEAKVDSAGEREHTLPNSVRRALREPRPRPMAEVWQFLRLDGRWPLAMIAAALVTAAAGALFEVVLLRGFLDIGSVLALREHRIIAVGMLLAVVATLLLLDVAISSAVLGLGRRLEMRLRMALLDKLPRLSERFFHSRLVSDMAYRAHTIDLLRGLPDLGGRFLRTSTQLIFTAVAIAWLDPPSVWVATLAAGLALLIPLSSMPLLAERELRQRHHSAGLSHYYLDSLLGLTAARSHSAERALGERHEGLLIEWGRSSLHLLRGSVVIEGLQMLLASIFAAKLVLDFVGRGGHPGGTLLLVYWALSLPTLGRELAGVIRQYPVYRNVLTRLLEPLSAPDETVALPQSTMLASPERSGVVINVNDAEVRLAGQTVLAGVTLSIGSREHVAIVGRSGAGKSTLVGMLLGSRTPTSGRVLVDGVPLDGHALAALRRSMAWVDPSVQLWNRSLFDNLRYGQSESLIARVGAVVETANLVGTLETLPAGLQSLLGEGGGLTSGGEGQRVRFGRALARESVRLAILDEPFRGLDRATRRELLARAREIWRDATMLCVTHDIEETLSFPRVLVVDQGRVVEDGDPAELAATAGSTYATLLTAERAVMSDIWSSARWRRWRMEDGAVAEEPSEAEGPWTASGHLRGL
jgi:ABC-type bacteriocin/lantibiotic exporter with double-glycine peptidase domain